MRKTPALTSRLTREVVACFKALGVHQMAISPDGASPEAPDGFRGVEGTLAPALRALDWAREVGLMTQVSHQANGQGLPGAFPPLTHLDKVVQAKGGREYLVRATLYGLQGPLTMEGKS